MMKLVLSIADSSSVSRLAHQHLSLDLSLKDYVLLSCHVFCLVIMNVNVLCALG